MNLQNSNSQTPVSPVNRMAIAATAMVAAASIVGWLGASHWAADLFAHFRAQYAVALGILLVVHVLRRQWVFGAVALVLLVLNVMQVAPIYTAPASQALLVKGPDLTVMQFNVLQSNARKSEVVAYLESSGADIIVLQEIDALWADTLSRGLRSYRSAIVESRPNNFGIALYIRDAPGIELERARLVRIDDEGWRHPAIEASLLHGGQRVEILGVHAHPPTNSNVARIHGIEIERVASWSRGRSGPHLVLGDFNMTPWSARYHALMSTSRLESARHGFGIVSSWRPLGGATGGLPLDHILHSADLSVTRFERGPRLGSDHQPILARLRWNVPTRSNALASANPARAPLAPSAIR